MPLPLSSKRLPFDRVLGLIAWGFISQAASGQNVNDAASAAPAAHVSLSTKMRLAQADLAFEAGNYDLAENRYRTVLNFDSHNESARKGLERIENVKGRAGVEDAANLSIAVLNAPAPSDPPDTTAIQNKLQSISIPFLEVYDMPLGDVLALIQKYARMYDTSPDVNTHGLNIFLKLPSSPSKSHTRSEAGIPGLPPGAEPATTTNFLLTPSAETKVTVVLSNASLWEALRQTASQAGLKVKVEQDAVAIVAQVEDCGVMDTLELPIPPSFLGLPAETTSSMVDENVGRSGQLGRFDAKEFLEASGVTFPPGSSAIYSRQKGKLVIRNLLANLELVKALLADFSIPAQPTLTP